MIKIYSHPRSGTNYLAALVAKNFYPNIDLKTKPGYIGHWADRAYVKGNPHGKLFGGHGLPRRYKNLKSTDVYIYRDGRDVALSIWNSQHFINPEWTKTMTFSQFLRTPLDWVSSPGDKANAGMNIFQHWKRHLEQWHDSKVMLVRYERLCTDTEFIMRSIASNCNITRFKFKPVNDYVGWFPSKSKSWKEVYTQNDIDFFYKMVGTNFYGIADSDD